jgi:hypothetical protein
MVRSKLRRTGVALATAMLVAACSGASDETPEVADIEELDASGGTEEAEDDASADAEGTEVAEDDVDADEPDQSTEPADDGTGTADGDPYAIPEDGIDEEYVERVLNAIFEVNREALALTLESEPGGLAPFEAEERLRAIYGGSYGARQLATLNQVSFSEAERSIFADPPGALRATVTDLVSEDPGCVIARRVSDFSRVLKAPPESRDGYVALAPKPVGSDPNHLNPTPWVISGGRIDSPETLTCDS